MFTARICKINRALLQHGVKRTQINLLACTKSSTIKTVPLDEKIKAEFNCSPHADPRPLRDMPGPSMFESLARIARHGVLHHHTFIEEMFERYGSIFKHSLPGIDVVYLSDPLDIEHVFRSEESKLPYMGELIIGKYFDEIGLDRGIVGSDKSWYVYRKAITEKILRIGVLKPYFNEMCNVADDTVALFNTGRNFDLKDHLTKWATENVGVLLFGLRMGTNFKSPNQNAVKLINAVIGYFEAEAKLLLGIPFHEYVKTPTLKKAFRGLDEMMEVSRGFVEKFKNEATDQLREVAIVHQLENMDKFPDRVVSQICVNLFAGGIHTTVGNVLLLFHTLSKHPEIQRKAYEEIQRVIGANLQPTYKHLSEMPYLKGIIKEGFRYNVSPLGNLRKIKCPVSVRGYQIPRGIRVVLATIASKEMQRQKYGDPERFAPERWFRSSAESRPNPFSNMPFGFGKRMCAGKRVVELELSLLLIRLLQKYEIMENSFAEEQVDWIFDIIVTADRPYVMHLKERN